MKDSFASLTLPIDDRPKARCSFDSRSTIIDCGALSVFIESADDVHALIDELQDAVREMAAAHRKANLVEWSDDHN